MKFFKKLFKWLAIIIGLIIISLYIFDYGYILRGVRVVYFTGHDTAFIDDYPYFENDIIEKGDNPQPWTNHKNYNSVKETEKLNTVNKDWGTVAYVIIKNDSVWFENYYDGFDENSKTNKQLLGKDPDTGLDLYAYDYVADVEKAERTGQPMGPKRVGPMAQDFEKVAPGSTANLPTSTSPSTCAVDLKDKVSDKYNLPENYILYVGTIEKRKNLATLVEAIGKSNTQLPLVAIGKQTDYTKEVTEMIYKYSLGDQVALLQNVSFLDLPAIYQSANLFVYPSNFEGFGIPILEALYSKTPVIAATGSCLEEAGGPNSIYVNPTDTDELAIQIDRVIESPELQLEMKEKGYSFAQNFTAEKQAKEVLEVYRNLKV